MSLQSEGTGKIGKSFCHFVVKIVPDICPGECGLMTEVQHHLQKSPHKLFTAGKREYRCTQWRKWAAPGLGDHTERHHEGQSWTSCMCNTPQRILPHPGHSPTGRAQRGPRPQEHRTALNWEMICQSAFFKISVVKAEITLRAHLKLNRD